MNVDMYFLNYFRCLICFFAIANVFGADDELNADNLRVENKSGHLCFTMFGRSKIDRTKFSELFENDSDMRYFSAPNEPAFKQIMDAQKNSPAGTVMILTSDPELLTEEECKQFKLSYFYKKREDKLFVMFFGYLGKEESQSLVFSDLINDAFSINTTISELEIYAPFTSGCFVGHTEFMKMSCHKERGVVKLQ